MDAAHDVAKHVKLPTNFSTGRETLAARQRPIMRDALASVAHEVSSMTQTAQFAVEEHVHGDTVWVAVRARGADWSWLTPEEAARLGRHWAEKYGSALPHPPAAE